MERVCAYIDGFNLYKGMKDAFGRKYLWLDLESMCRSVLLPTQELIGVKYFTARVRRPADTQQRQSLYIDALAAATSVQTIFGRLQMNTVECLRCGHERIKPEEKKTDVAIATHMVADAVGGTIDVALVVSGDSDMVPPVEMISGLPKARVVLAFPPRRKSDELKRYAGAAFTLSEATLRQNQLPPTVKTVGGVLLTRPASWK